MSVIATTYANLAAMQVAVGLVTPTAYAPDALPTNVETALLPCRVLDPSYSPDSGDYSFVAYGTTATVHWHITDLLLWEQVGQTRGPLDVALDLISYCGAYAEAVRQHRGIASQTALQTATPRVDFAIEWPKGSGVYFYGVEMQLELEEVLSG